MYIEFCPLLSVMTADSSVPPELCLWLCECGESQPMGSGAAGGSARELGPFLVPPSSGVVALTAPSSAGHSSSGLPPTESLPAFHLCSLCEPGVLAQLEGSFRGCSEWTFWVCAGRKLLTLVEPAEP